MVSADEGLGVAEPLPVRMLNEYAFCPRLFHLMHAEGLWADNAFTADGQRGSFVEQIRKGKCLIFYTHAQTLYGNGTKSGFRVFQMAIERLRQHYRDRIEWMTGLEVCGKFCPPRGS